MDPRLHGDDHSREGGNPAQQLNMNKFRTEIEIPSSDHKISHQSTVLLIGSCFSEHIGNSLAEYKFNVDINPTGIVYNPLSALSCLRALVENKKYLKEDLYETNGRYVSFDHHGSFSDPNPDECLRKINERIKKASDRLATTDYIILTFGTAWVYRLADSGRVVSNNHKLPAKYFTRELLKKEVIISHYQELILEILKTNPNLRFIFTVSPVRHWKDGARFNMVSKSTLILAVHELTGLFETAEYFPAYELAMDDLRDYRFYAGDMIHPNSQMTDYIWEKFSQTYFTGETIKLIEKLESINRARDHKPFYPGTEEHKKFLNIQLKTIEELEKNHSFLDFSAEKEYFDNQLH